jgi:AcrR family transcriptional regulator
VAKKQAARKQVVRKRAPRKTPDLHEIISVTTELLLQHGDSGFRIEDVIERTGISKSSLYLHFGDRDGLVAAAYAQMFTTEANQNIAQAIAVFAKVKTKDQLDEAIAIVVQALVNTPKNVRWNRIDVLSSARHKPEFLARIVEAQSRMNSALEEVFRTQQELGNVRKDMNPREMAALIQGVSFGRLFRDIDNRLSDNDLAEWSKLATSVYNLFKAEK